jgi:hypothetical protein
MDRQYSGESFYTLPTGGHTDRCQSELQKKCVSSLRTVDQDHTKVTTDPSSPYIDAQLSIATCFIAASAVVGRPLQ